MEVLPIARPGVQLGMPGWCTAAALHVGAPEVEYFCGGVNTKLPTHAGLWREGNFFHFGFEPSPAELNDAGQGMLVNSIVYISKFTEDRPIGSYTSPFVSKGRNQLRSSAGYWVSSPQGEDEWVLPMFAERLRSEIAKKSRAERKAWFESVRPWLHAGADGSLDIDDDVKDLGVSYDDPKFLERLGAELALGDAAASARAARLVARYAPGACASGAPVAAAAFEAWRKENANYVFYSEVCGCQWLVDPLAKARGVPTAELRGAKRADAPKLGAAQEPRPELDAELRRLEADYRAADAKYYKPVREAKSDAERRAAVLDPKNRPDLVFLPKYRELATRARGTPAGLDALVAMLRIGIRGDAKEVAASLAAVIDEAIANYGASPRLDALVRAIDSMGWYVGDAKFHASLERIAAQSPHAEVRAAARFARATTLFSGRGLSGGAPATTAEEKQRRKGEAYALFEAVVAEAPASSFGKSARGYLYERDVLAVGKPAPDFDAKDSDGVAFKLSELRGNVVVLDFWGFW